MDNIASELSQVRDAFNLLAKRIDELPSIVDEKNKTISDIPGEHIEHEQVVNTFNEQIDMLAKEKDKLLEIINFKTFSFFEANNSQHEIQDYQGNVLNMFTALIGDIGKANLAGLLISRYFNEKAYIEYNSDILAAYAAEQIISPLDHRIKHGRIEGRRFYYCDDALNMFTILINDIDKLGLTELLVSKHFNEKVYLEHNPDVLKSYSLKQIDSPLSHWIRFGLKEGRRFY